MPDDSELSHSIGEAWLRKLGGDSVKDALANLLRTQPPHMTLPTLVPLIERSPMDAPDLASWALPLVLHAQTSEDPVIERGERQMIQGLAEVTQWKFDVFVSLANREGWKHLKAGAALIRKRQNELLREAKRAPVPTIEVPVLKITPSKKAAEPKPAVEERSTETLSLKEQLDLLSESGEFPFDGSAMSQEFLHAFDDELRSAKPNVELLVEAAERMTRRPPFDMPGRSEWSRIRGYLLTREQRLLDQKPGELERAVATIGPLLEVCQGRGPQLPEFSIEM